MDVKKGYVPDVSSFFNDGRQHTAADIFELPEMRQETVAFEMNDLYLNLNEVVSDISVNGQNVQIYRKKQVCRKFGRKKHCRRRVNGNFKGTSS